jgi:hypothetical protein
MTESHARDERAADAMETTTKALGRERQLGSDRRIPASAFRVKPTRASRLWAGSFMDSPSSQVYLRSVMETILRDAAQHGFAALTMGAS